VQGKERVRGGAESGGGEKRGKEGKGRKGKESKNTSPSIPAYALAKKYRQNTVLGE